MFYEHVKCPHLTQFHVILILFSFSLVSSLVEMTSEVLSVIIRNYSPAQQKPVPDTHPFRTSPLHGVMIYK